MMRSRLTLAALVVFAASLAAAPLSATGQEAETVAAEQPMVVLDTAGFWRLHHQLSPPLIEFDDGLKPVLMTRWLDEPTPAAPVAWIGPDFDDGDWLRGPAMMACKTPYLERLSMRGKFAVTDAAKVSDLRLSVEYHGAAILYVNGTEVARGNVAAAADGTQMAEVYPHEAYVTPDGEIISDRSNRTDEVARRLAMRTRSLAEIEIPQRLLRRGVNVVAVEILRAPYSKMVKEKVDPKMRTPYGMSWNTCEIRAVRLTAAPGSTGLVPNAARPQGLQVWNRDVMGSDFDLDYGDPNEPLRPIALVAPRNGTASGKVVLGSTAAIRGLAVTPSELKCGATVIPASRVQIRYGLAWGQESITRSYTGEQMPYPASPSLLESLAEKPLAEFPVREKPVTEYCLKRPGQPAPAFGAVVPVWVTVRVPADVAAGDYSGSLTIRAEGEEPVTVPVSLKVVDWLLPDPQNWATWVELIQSPDTLAVEYDVPLWSEENFRMIARSMDFLSEVGSRVVYVPLICHTNNGNEQSMVRWIPKSDGGYEYDFSVMERYLDLAEKHMGRPTFVVFNVWEVYIIPRDKKAEGQEANAIRYLKEKNALVGSGPTVTMLDPVTGAAEAAVLPGYAAPQSRALWEPLFKELRRRMARRKLDGAMVLGTFTDARPTKEELEFLSEVSDGLPWISHAHHGAPGNMATFVYQTRVWNIDFAAVDWDKRKFGWKSPSLIADYERHRDINTLPPTNWRHMGEWNIAGEQRGVGRVGADYWPVVRDKRGERRGTVGSRYPQSSRRNLDLYSCLLSPGPDGPVATARYESFREGIQECEARIVIERALTDDALREKLGDSLSRRCRDALVEHVLCMYKGLSNLQLYGYFWSYATSWRGSEGVAGHTWFVGSGWQRRTERLYALAGEVERALAQK